MIARLFHLRPGDFRRSLPLVVYSFLTFSSYYMGQAARDALFLEPFQARELPYYDIAVAVLAGAVIAVYIRLSRMTSLRNLLMASLAAYAVNAFLLWWVFHYHAVPWLPRLLYLWLGIFGALAPMQVWTLAHFVWNTREAKRLFTLVGSGGIAGASFGGFLSQRIAGEFGTESLLLAMALSLLVCPLIVDRTWREASRRAGAEPDREAAPADGPKDFAGSLRLIFASRDSRHLQTIALLICLSSIVTTAIGWQLKAVVQETVVAKDAMAAFFGAFYGYTGIAALAVQLFVTARLLRRYGVGAALLVLPCFLLAGSFAILVSGALWAASLAKGSHQVFSYSIDTSARQILYLPIPFDVKVQAQSFIDTVVRRFGDGLAGVILLVLVTWLDFNRSQVAAATAVLLLGWLAAAFLARRQYVAMLNRSIRQSDLDPAQASVPVLDLAASNILAARLNSADTGEILYALSLFGMGQQPQVHSAVRNLLDHPSPQVRARAVAILNEMEDAAVRDRVALLLHDESLEVRTEALHFLSRQDHFDPLANIEELGNFSDYSICSAAVAFLARPGETQNLDAARLILDGMVKDRGGDGLSSRLAAARLLSDLPDCGDCFDEQLGLLLSDDEAEVVGNAIRAVGATGRRKWIPEVAARLAFPEWRTGAGEVLASFGDSIVPTLIEYLEDTQRSIEARREIPGVLLRIGTPAAAAALMENLMQPDSVVRYRMIVALNKLCESRRDLRVDRELIEAVLAAEIMGHYRSYQILGTLSGQGDALLQDSMRRELERIFRLMKLLFRDIDFENAFRGIQSKNPVLHANALEFLDNALNPQLRGLLVPLIDAEVGLRERIELADRLLNIRVSSNEEAIAALVHSEDPWLKSCAVYAIGKLRLQSFAAELDGWARDPDPLLQKRIAQARLLLQH